MAQRCLRANGRIAGVLPHSEARAHISAETEIVDAENRLVTPGFVDAHTHLVFAGNRADEFARRIAGETYQQIAASGGGIQNTMAKTRAASEEELFTAAQEKLRWFLAGGTTTIEAKSGYGLSFDDELKILRVLRALERSSPVRIVPTVLAAHAVPPEYKARRSGYVELVCGQILPRVAEEQLARYCDVFCDEHAFTLEESEHILQTAKRLGFGLRVHAEQFAADGSAEMAASLGAATVDHMECSQRASFASLRAAGTQPVLLPASVFCIGGTRYPDARGMIAEGLAPVVATDFNPGSSPTTSLPFVMSLACLQMKMTPAEALTAATINAAYSLGLGSECGSLEAGKSADFCVWPYRSHQEIAYYAAIPAGPRVWAASLAVG